MIKQFLNIRDFLLSSVVSKNCYDTLNKKVIDSIAASVETYEWTKKKEELKPTELRPDLEKLPENTSEKDLITASESEV